MRDGDGRRAVFGDVEKFQTLTFKSTHVTRKSNDSFDVAGNLTIHGITRPVTLSTTWTRFSTVITLPSIAGKTLGTANDHYTALQFFFSSGANNAAVAGNIGVQSGSVALWGVQLEIVAPGQTTPSPLEKMDAQQTLAACQRFAQLLPAIAVANYTPVGGQNALGEDVEHVFGLNRPSHRVRKQSEITTATAPNIFIERVAIKDSGSEVHDSVLVAVDVSPGDTSRTLLIQSVNPGAIAGAKRLHQLASNAVVELVTTRWAVIHCAGHHLMRHGVRLLELQEGSFQHPSRKKSTLRRSMAMKSAGAFSLGLTLQQ
jgi:hypothetical protein